MHRLLKIGSVVFILIALILGFLAFNHYDKKGEWTVELLEEKDQNEHSFSPDQKEGSSFIMSSPLGVATLALIFIIAALVILGLLILGGVVIIVGFPFFLLKGLYESIGGEGYLIYLSVGLLGLGICSWLISKRLKKRKKAS